MGRCHAKFCDIDDLKDEEVFCHLHWDIMPQDSKDKISRAYGTADWVPVLAEVVQELILAEGDYKQFSPDAIQQPTIPPKRDPRIRRGFIIEDIKDEG